jgi:hypothetical protein
MSSKPTRVLLCTPQYLIENSAINSNVEQKILTKCIRTAEDKYLMPLIGSNMYQAIMSAVTNGSMTAGAKKTLVDDYLLPTIAEYALLRKKGLQKQNSGENSESASMDDLTYMLTAVRDTCQFYAQRTIKFLLANIQDYPEYYQYTTIDNIPPARSDYFGGIQFPKSNRGGCDTFGMGLGIDINI